MASQSQPVTTEPGLAPAGEPIEQLARDIGRRRLSVPALVLLELVRPFGFLFSQALLLAGPLSSYLFEGPRMEAYADLLADRSGIDRLVALLVQEVGSDRASGEIG